MKQKLRIIIPIVIFVLLVALSLMGILPQTEAPDPTGTGATTAPTNPAPSQTNPIETGPSESTSPTPELDADGVYDSKEDVALYIHLYGKLPKNFVNKDDAERLYGWDGGALDEYKSGMCIGGDRFGNREGILPKKNGRYYTECDIDTIGESSRGAKRIVFSNDGLIYYTDDHYETFELLYGEP